MPNVYSKKRLTAFFITAGILTLFFSNTIFAADETASEATTQETQQTETTLFSDVEIGDTNFVAIKYLKENSLIDGYPDGNFKPLDEINRAEALKMILKAIKETESPTEITTQETGTSKNSTQETLQETTQETQTQETSQTEEQLIFEDVKTSDWFHPFVLEAFNNSLIKGYPDGLFHPEKTINLVESLKIILLREGGEIPTEVTEQSYNDVQINEWYAPYAQIAKERTIVLKSRNDSYMFPDKNVNRGFMADLLYRTIKSKEGSSFARATWYADLLANQKTASGEPYIPNHYTVAHKTLPFGTKLLVTNLANGKVVEVTVNDRGPYANGVDLDLSKSAFADIASVGAGIINTEFKIITEEETTANEIEYGF